MTTLVLLAIAVTLAAVIARSFIRSWRHYRKMEREWRIIAADANTKLQHQQRLLVEKRQEIKNQQESW